MRAASTPSALPPALPAHPPRRARGFTLVELIMVLLLVGVMAAVALPRLEGALGMAGTAWREQLGSAMLHARATAQGHRRLVCATLATGEVRLTLATQNPATSCTTPLRGIDRDLRWAHHEGGLALSQSPAGTLYFQPDGRITRDALGLTPATFTVTLAGERNLILTGETGHVD